MTSSSHLCIGVIIGAHGIQGQVRIRSFTDDPESLFKYKPVTDKAGLREFKLKKSGIARDAFIVTLADVKDRNAAEALRGTELFVDRGKLPRTKKNEFYEADLVGLEARDQSGRSYGKVIATHNYGAGTFLEIGANKKDSFMLPFTDACVPKIEAEDGAILIAPPDGWLDKEEKPN
jgi:16S rRNA processing protein RimM